ncbi:MAG: DUF1566 domain-containing protein [Bacteroidales bacterium]|nr:DUF1566 domain-containing protein [Bacteroidales bacterium]
MKKMLMLKYVCVLIMTVPFISSCEREWKNEYDENKVLKIGYKYAGGIIFYLDGNGGGLVCAESDQSSSAEFGCRGTLIDGTRTGFGTGVSNTIAILDICNEANIAASICYDLSLNGYNDWFLPSKEELNLMYMNLKQEEIGDFATKQYWSSSEYYSSEAWIQHFYNGSQYEDGKNMTNHVRAVRAF